MINPVARVDWIGIFRCGPEGTGSHALQVKPTDHAATLEATPDGVEFDPCRAAESRCVAMS
jgi:hypothetical protein